MKACDTELASVLSQEQGSRRTLLILTSSSFMPASRPMYANARSIAALRSGVVASSGWGTVPVIGATSWGEVPHVTVGAISAEEILTMRSK